MEDDSKLEWRVLHVNCGQLRFFFFAVIHSRVVAEHEKQMKGCDPSVLVEIVLSQVVLCASTVHLLCHDV